MIVNGEQFANIVHFLFIVKMLQELLFVFTMTSLH